VTLGSARRLLFAGLLTALAASAADATTLDDAIALALKHDPGLARAAAVQDAAHARLDEARAGRLPSVTLTASVADAPTDFGHFFGFTSGTLTPRSVGVELRQPIFAGGAVGAAIDQAEAGEAGAHAGFESARQGLVVEVAEAFEAVRLSAQGLALQQSQVAELSLVQDQAQRRFQDGAAPKTDVDEAAARLAGARADVARAEGDLAIARARYETLVGETPADLEVPAELPAGPPDINAAVAAAEASNPALTSAQAALRGADDGVRKAKAERAPTVALVAQASSVRDEFLPGYRADAASIGVEGRWTLFSGGLVAGKISEAAAQQRGAEASLRQVRAQVEEQAIDAWHGLNTARAVALAAAAQSRAADDALANVREEVRVGEKPTLDLLDAEREALAAHIGALKADATVVVAGYRLRAVTGA
jgi:outer membrane protein